MEVNNRVVLREMKENEEDTFWINRDIDYSSVGTIIFVIKDIDTPAYIEVLWGNGSKSLCDSTYLKLYEEKEISLPNLKFKRRR